MKTPYGKNLTIVGHVSRRKPYLSAVNKQKRLAFADECVNKSTEFWENNIIL